MKLSLVLPTYNEEENIKKGVLDRVFSYFKNKDFSWEVIIVDDGSDDQTKKLLEDKYLKQNIKLRLIEKTHQGKAYSIIEGIKKAKGDIVAFSDFDLATPIEEVDKLLEFIDKFDIVIGSRNNVRKGAPLIRKIMAKGFIFIRDLFINLNGIRDTQCGFKLFKKDVAIKIINALRVFKVEKRVKGPSVSAGFDLEFLYLAKKMGFQIKEVPVLWHYAETRRVNFFKDSIETMIDILKIKFNELLGKYV